MSPTSSFTFPEQARDITIADASGRGVVPGQVRCNGAQQELGQVPRPDVSSLADVWSLDTFLSLPQRMSGLSRRSSVAVRLATLPCLHASAKMHIVRRVPGQAYSIVDASAGAAVPTTILSRSLLVTDALQRVLRGHANIVQLYDAAWSKQPNGTFEVFILMEFCPGGGIIDMMNRRLRERLTEQEILQIFVDVCEGVACMHNLKPPLLHRDLKVENILQASPTRFKLCDFGSSCGVAPRPPSTLQEIQALGADLDRHTTLQYRAPEMIDPNLRRPIDEKSDVWALGVLLYKLCYYTTPFEEHGPLAILNVQYTTPPYPVYSPQMNQLIGAWGSRRLALP